MEAPEIVLSTMEEIQMAQQKGYLSQVQVQIVESRLKYNASYNELIKQFSISGRTALTHALFRTATLKFWTYKMTTQDELATKINETTPPSKSWLNHLVKNSELKISAPQQIEFDRRHSCNVPVIYFYHMLHQHLFKWPTSHILNLDETMLTAFWRLKVLARRGRLPLIPEAVKVTHFTGCVTFLASRYLFDPLVIMPNKKTLRKLTQNSDLTYFPGSMDGWQTSNTFVYYSMLLVCQLSAYKLTLPKENRDERFLLIVDSHPSRFTFNGCLMLFLFDIDIVLLPPRTSHLLQLFDVAVAASLKTNFKEELIIERFDSYVQNGIDIPKQTSSQLRDSMIQSFINALRKISSLHNIESGFRKSGILPFNVEEPLKSEYEIDGNVEYDYANVACQNIFPKMINMMYNVLKIYNSNIQGNIQY